MNFVALIGILSEKNEDNTIIKLKIERGDDDENNSLQETDQWFDIITCIANVNEIRDQIGEAEIGDILGLKGKLICRNDKQVMLIDRFQKF